MLAYPLPPERTTLVTEAVENVFDEVISGLADLNAGLQLAISAATTGSMDEYVVEANRLGALTLRGWVSTWAAIIDGLGLVAANEVQWWWTSPLKPRSVTGGALGAERPVVAKATVQTVPEGETVPLHWVRVACVDGESVRYVDRASRATRWDGTCYVTVRQHDDFIPRAVRLTLTLTDLAGNVVDTSEPMYSVLSLAPAHDG